MDVTVAFADVPDGPLRLHMSRSSPGRYALHQFAKNMFDLRVTDGAGARARRAAHRAGGVDRARARPAPSTVSYRVFGDRVDGTYLSVDATHAHINMPAAILWAVGLDRRPIEVRFEPPPGSDWRVATQLFPGADEFTFTAPNLQYLMDSPAEVGTFDLRSFTVADGARTPTFRVAVHHSGDGAELDAFARDVEKIVREARNVYGEFALFDGGTYTFLADYLPHGNCDGMEHRNSTVITAGVSIRGSRLDLLDTVAHEFFHSWNVERIRPRSLEPFNFDDANMSGELWLAEGFTSYFGALVMRRAGLTTTRELAQEMGRVVNAVLNSPGGSVRTAEEMSQQAPFMDAATATDRTSFENTFISYYTWGEAIGLALDLSLRERTAAGPRSMASCARCGNASASRAASAGLCGPSPTRSTTRGRCSARWRARRVRRAVLRTLHPGARGGRLRAAARARRPAGAAVEPGAGVCRRPAAADRTTACGWRPTCRSTARRLRPASSATTGSCRSPARRSTSEAMVREAIARRKPGESRADRVRAPRRRARRLDAASRGRPAGRGRHLRGRRPLAHRAPTAVSAGPGWAATGNGRGAACSPVQGRDSRCPPALMPTVPTAYRIPLWPTG